MSRWKSVKNEKTDVLERVPVDAAAFLEVLELDYREKRVGKDEYLKKKAEIVNGIAALKISEKEASAVVAAKVSAERLSIAKAQEARKKSAASASKARSAEKAKRKEPVAKGAK